MRVQNTEKLTPAKVIWKILEFGYGDLFHYFHNSLYVSFLCVTKSWEGPWAMSRFFSFYR